MKILLLSAYTAESHRYWIEGLEGQFTNIEWTILHLPPRYFSWRIRGNSLTWAFSQKETLSKCYDLVLATSMVDLSSLRGMIPQLTRIPTIVYFHENQFAYPESNSVKNNSQGIEPQIVNLYSAVCANRIVFNSQYNRQSFLQGVKQLMKKLPDGIPLGLVEKLDEKCEVLPVPLNQEELHFNKSIFNERPEIIWNHRWEYDKGPERLLLCLKHLSPELKITVHVVGQSFRQQPNAFVKIKEILVKNNWLGQWGYVESRADYIQLLANSDIVLSTALHDFQGLSVLEAFYLGCVPIIPNRLAYSELFLEKYRYRSNTENEEEEARSAVSKINEVIEDLQTYRPRGDENKALDWKHLQPNYQILFETVISQFRNVD